MNLLWNSALLLFQVETPLQLGFRGMTCIVYQTKYVMLHVMYCTLIHTLCIHVRVAHVTTCICNSYFSPAPGPLFPRAALLCLLLLRLSLQPCARYCTHVCDQGYVPWALVKDKSYCIVYTSV